MTKQCNDHHGYPTVLQFSAPCADMLHSHCTITEHLPTGNEFNGKKVLTIKTK
jgi:hypothetical protein